MKIIGIETSCDETGIALYDTELGLLAHSLYSQIELHNEYGGVVPELASRDHIRRTLPLIHETLAKADCSLKNISAIAYTAGPGLAGALLVGASIANSLAFSLNIRAIPIHHLEGHLLSPLLSNPKPQLPFVALLVSGGHTQLMEVRAIGEYKMLGETLDDAAGEAFDKTAKLLGLSYPGGPALAKLAEQGQIGKYNFPRPMINSSDLNFSFSGLKTAVATLVNNEQLSDMTKANIAHAVQEAITDVLVSKATAAINLTGLQQLVIAGGVGANRKLREKLSASEKKYGFKVFYPEFEFCTDNGAMIAFAGAMRLKFQHQTDYAFDVKPRWPLMAMNTT
jgi:N6-L-threonylcarbamoyladenine synthase